ncbi:MAG: TA system VapC family ribonuclease toxin [Terracidiphilus sp.]|jgi:toxin-antitoxin system PIN domain toxin
MTSYFPDLNIWLALSDVRNAHNAIAWAWINNLAPDDRLTFSRYTQIGLLRLLTNNAVMGDQTLTLSKAWAVYDRWLEDPRVEFCPEPRQVEESFRLATLPFGDKAASKWVGDCWLLAFAQATHSCLVTFDQALCEFAQKLGHAAVRPS